MKSKIIGVICGVVAMSSSPVMADLEGCKAIASLAEMGMKLRQAGVPLADVLSIEMEDPELVIITRKIAMYAYTFPVYRGEEMKLHTITEFWNEFLMVCLEATEF